MLLKSVLISPLQSLLPLIHKRARWEVLRGGKIGPGKIGLGGNIGPRWWNQSDYSNIEYQTFAKQNRPIARKLVKSGY